MTIATTAQAAGASVELANISVRQVEKLVGRSEKKLQRFLRDVSAWASSG
jgi:histidine ammonia-lyase